MTTAQINGIEIYYEEHGDPNAEPVLLIMGYLMNAGAWAPQIPALAARYRVIAFDNRGAGRSSQPDEPYTMEQMTADAAGVLDAVGIRSAHVVGASMGGMIAQNFALAHPERVRTLTLACTTPGGPMSAGYTRMVVLAESVADVEDLAALMTPEAIKQIMLEHFTPAFIAAPATGFLQMAGSMMQYPSSLAGMKGQLAAILAHNTYDRLAQITAPTLIIAGDMDPLVDSLNSRIMAERIPNAELRYFEGLRHGFTAEKPDEVNAVILEFLARRAAAAA